MLIRAGIVLAALSLAVLVACCPVGAGGRQSAEEKAAAIELLKRIIAAINTRDDAKMRAVFTANVTNDVPLDARLQRMSGFAEQGAPFRIEPGPIATSTDVRAVLVDRAGVRLSIFMATTGGTVPKMKSMRVGPEGASEGPNSRIPDWKDLRSLAATLAAERRIPAMGIAVIRGGRLEKAVTGVRRTGGAEPVGVDEPWSIGSIGKPICSTIIGRLIEQGKLRWNETLGEALKGITMQPGYESVTIEQVMQHRGGIPQDLGFGIARIREITGSATSAFEIRERYAHDILSRKPIAGPGERNAYSNAGYALLGHIAERVAGKPYEQLVRDMVFGPLRLKHSFTGADALPVARPSGHIVGPDGLKPANMSGPLEKIMAPAGGGIFMSTVDLAKFGAEHLKGLRGQDGLLKASTVARLHRGIPEHAGDNSFLYACGWGIESTPGIETFHGHNGSNGTFRAQLAIFPKAGIVAAAMVNCGGEEEPSPCLTAVLAIARRYSK